MQPAWQRWFRYENARRSAGDVTPTGEACALSALGLTRAEWEMLGEETRRVMVARWVEGHELSRTREEVAREVGRVAAPELLAYLGGKADCGGGTVGGREPRRVDPVTGEPTAETPPELTGGPTGEPPPREPVRVDGGGTPGGGATPGGGGGAAPPVSSGVGAGALVAAAVAAWFLLGD